MSNSIAARQIAAPRPNAGNPVRGPLNALFFKACGGYLNWLLRDKKLALFEDLPQEIVELGAGVGANFPFYARGTRVVAVEPNPHMHGGLAAAADKHGIDLEVHASGAEIIPLPDNSADAIVCTLVLCTVDRPREVLAEVKRVLKPGGRFIFLEHIAAPRGSWRRYVQEAVYGPWHFCFEGCHTNRHTSALLEHAGFARVDMVEYTMGGPLVPANLQIAGVATVR